MRRKAQRLVDPRLELVGEVVLEPLGLLVDRIDPEPERLGELLLEQPMVADDLDGRPFAGGR